MNKQDRDRRRLRVMAMRNSGATRKEVAQALGIGQDTVQGDERAAIDEVMATSVHDYVGRQLTEIRDLKRPLYRQALGGDAASIDRVVRLMDREAKLLGLDAPQRAHVTVSHGDFAQRAADLMHELGMHAGDEPEVIEHDAGDELPMIEREDVQQREPGGGDNGPWVL